MLSKGAASLDGADEGDRSQVEVLGGVCREYVLIVNARGRELRVAGELCGAQKEREELVVVETPHPM